MLKLNSAIVLVMLKHVCGIIPHKLVLVSYIVPGSDTIFLENIFP